MSSLKRAVCDTMVSFLKARPELAGVPVQALQADYETDVEYPHVVVMPQRLTFQPWQEDEVDESVTGRVLLHLGDFEGNLEIRCCALTPVEREVLEEKVLAVFMERDLAPGVLVLQLPAVKLGGDQFALQPTATFALDDETWNEEMVFDAPRYSYLTVPTVFPALANRGALTIDRMILALTQDLNSDVPDESRQVNADGSMLTL